MYTKRTTGQKLVKSMLDVITNYKISKCAGHKNREYVYCHMSLSSL